MDGEAGGPWSRTDRSNIVYELWEREVMSVLSEYKTDFHIPTWSLGQIQGKPRLEGCLTFREAELDSSGRVGPAHTSLFSPVHTQQLSYPGQRWQTFKVRLRFTETHRGAKESCCSTSSPLKWTEVRKSQIYIRLDWNLQLQTHHGEKLDALMGWRLKEF